jgi:hypothetical protein
MAGIGFLPTHDLSRLQENQMSICPFFDIGDWQIVAIAVVHAVVGQFLAK